MSAEQLKQAIKRNYLKMNADVKKVSCPSEETVVNYLGRQLPPDITSLVEGHLAACSDCAERVILLRRVEADSSTVDVPEHLLSRVKNVVAEKLSSKLLDITLQFKEDVCDVIRATGDVLQIAGVTPIPVAIRGKSGAERVDITKISKVLGPTLVEVNVEKKGAASFSFTVVVADPLTKNPVNNVRVSLFKEKRELESLLTQNGTAVFKKLLFSRYKMHVLKDHALIGEVVVDLRKA